MNIATVLNPNRVWCQAPGGSKKRVLENLSDFLAEQIPALNAGELFTQLIARERLGSTGLGFGIAIPHCRLSTIEEPVGALARLETPIDFDSPDDEPVDLLFVLVVPEASNEAHLELLAALASQFSQPAWCQRLRDATSATELFDAAVAA
ncbi:MAG TPA: PTS IIA-like nitrogen regulatory protein PtsN [Pseudomonadales bacterium]